ncbi:hypothetical protein C1752_01363 [Acaryochloris thomasi RCC1774]|uniref:Right handed beta helix domain-containing protein n=1 Tax=Acaryochloris thomasi RCC1774 TaxID=1764569 RepID=A0A2W1JLP0_9CYAN|nr:hypothetical protein [Acaryochloris thomasi]PZD74126.1 hypothetical protein C1752_01363 [Acaryochloris thomasi RCC1774]
MRLKANSVRAILLVSAVIVTACGDSKATSEAARQDPKPADVDLKIEKVKELPPSVASAGSNPEPVPLPTSGEACNGTPVRTVEALQRAVANSQTIALSAGVFELPQSLRLQTGTTLCGQGADKTTVRGAATWQPGLGLLPKLEDPNAYLFIVEGQNNVTIRDMSLQGPQLHGAVYGKRSQRLTLAGLELRDFMWSSVRTFNMVQTRIHDNDFIDAGGYIEKEIDGKIRRAVGGVLFDQNPQECEVWNNRVRASGKGDRRFFGFKGRSGRNCRFHHNDIRSRFAIEYPFDNIFGFEIDHNYIEGTISIPKFGGGPVLDSSALAVHIHHNVIRRSYAIEFARNNVRINHNLFDFKPQENQGNLISDHGRQPSPGPLLMQNNLIQNVGRGIFWSRPGYNNVEFINNHVRALGNPQPLALFQFNPSTDFQSIKIAGNIFESAPDSPRPLLQDGIGSNAIIENNKLTNILDSGLYANPQTGGSVGPTEPLQFRAGVRDEIQVDQWTTTGVRP